MKSLFLLALLFLFSFFPAVLVQGQSNYQCGSTNHNQELQKSHPRQNLPSESDKKFQTMQEQYLKDLLFANEPWVKSEKLNGPCPDFEESLVVPVVIHVVHKPADYQRGMGSNLSDQKILDGIKWLNEAFDDAGYYSGGPSNPNPIVQDQSVHVEFKLVLVDGNGDTTQFSGNSGSGQEGICRWPSTYSQIQTTTVDDMMQSIQIRMPNGAFSSEDVLNLYIVDEIENGDIAGLASYPYYHGDPDDGIVVIHDVFDDRDYIKVLVHEVGHYLGLLHTFEGGCTTASRCTIQGDKICDTPPSVLPTTNKTTCDNTCSNDTLIPLSPFKSDQPDLCENFMDYSPLSVQNSFTTLQRWKMRNELQGARSSLLQNFNWIDSETPAASLPYYNHNTYNANVCETFRPTVLVKNIGQVKIDSIYINLNVNSSNIYRKWVKTEITPGETKKVFLPEVLLNKGTNTILINLYGLNEIGLGEMRDWETCYFVKPFDEVDSSMIGHQNFWLQKSWAANWRIGGSIRCDGIYSSKMRFNPTDSEIEQDKNEVATVSIDLKNAKSCWFSFNHGYTHMSEGFESGFRITITDDCWEHETVVLDLKGDNLKTSNDNSTDSRWEPECNEWQSHLIDLSQFSGKEDIHINLIGYKSGDSGFGNSLYVNDVKIFIDSCVPKADLLTELIYCGDSASIAPSKKAFRWSNGEQTDSLLVKKTSSNWVIYQTNTHCLQKDSFDVILNPIPSKPIIARNEDILLCDVSDAERYEWFLNGVYIENSTSFIWKAEEIGEYTVRYYDENDCFAESDPLKVEILGISEVHSSFSVYPNPSNGTITVSGEARINDIEVYDMLGQQVEAEVLEVAKGKQIQFQGQTGVFLLNLQTDEGVIVKRVEVY